MFWRKKKGKPSLKEQRDSVRDAIKRAIAQNDMDKYAGLNDLLQKLENKIRRKKWNN
jgi:hypothetical protein